jgi:hypothetical protein
MPAVSFASLPADARVWVFASDRALDESASRKLLTEVDGFLNQWNAHGHPLTCARDWRDAMFLAVGVDQSTAGASGCSIDGLFRTLKGLEPTLGASLLPAGRVYWRDAEGGIANGERSRFTALGTEGRVTASTRVFDTTVNTASAWRASFERPAGETWHATLLKASRAGV